MFMRINSIRYNNSVVDGPGIRTVLFMQGCDLHCKGCQNRSTWNIEKGKNTGHQKEDVPSILLDKVKYLKTGNFIQELKTTVKPFVGSENQVFEEVK